jgi:hypothetical protein
MAKMAHAVAVMALVNLILVSAFAESKIDSRLKPVVSGTVDNNNRFMIGVGRSIRNGDVQEAGFVFADQKEGRSPVYLGSEQCTRADTDENTLYATRPTTGRGNCMTVYGYLMALNEEFEGRSRISVWRGDLPNNLDLLYVNPDIRPGTGYTQVGYLIGRPAR